MPSVRSAHRGCPRRWRGPSKAWGQPGLDWAATKLLAVRVDCGLCVHVAGKRLSKYLFLRLSQYVAKAGLKLIIPLPQHLQSVHRLMLTSSWSEPL